jgi:hypothetical protein
MMNCCDLYYALCPQRAGALLDVQYKNQCTYTLTRQYIKIHFIDAHTNEEQTKQGEES